nr:hypothetical protein [Shinella sp.]
MLTRRPRPIGISFVEEFVGLLGMRWNEGLAPILDVVDAALQFGRACRLRWRT